MLPPSQQVPELSRPPLAVTENDDMFELLMDRSTMRRDLFKPFWSPSQSQGFARYEDEFPVVSRKTDRLVEWRDLEDLVLAEFESDAVDGDKRFILVLPLRYLAEGGIVALRADAHALAKARPQAA